MNVSESKSFVFLFSCFLQYDGEEEQRRFEEGKARYLHNKAKRLADKERQMWRHRSPELNAWNDSISAPCSTRSMKEIDPFLLFCNCSLLFNLNLFSCAMHQSVHV